MATICFPTVRGRVARFTRLDQCGRPKAGPCSTIVSDDIVSIKASAEVEEGEEISVKNMGGKLCISDKPCDSIKWFTIEIVLCKVMPPLLSLTSGYDNVLDADGNIVGYDVSGEVLCDGGFGLEVWGDVPGVKCLDGDASGASGQYSYLVFPWVSAATLTGDLEIQNDALQPTLSGTTKTGHSWGTGPYNVQMGVDDKPGPLIQPIPPDKHFRHMVVTVIPPEPACECVELAAGPKLAVAETQPPAEDRLSVTATVSEASDADKTVYIDWGDGSPRDTLDEVPGTVDHAYAAEGDYVVSAGYVEGGGSVSSATVTVPFTAPVAEAPTIAAAEATPPADDRQSTTVTVSKAASGKTVTLDWGDGGDPEEVPKVPGSLTHAYAEAGDYTVTAGYADGQGRTSTAAVTVPYTTPLPDAPTFTAAETDPHADDRRGVTASVTAAADGQTVTIDWGDDTEPDTLDAVPGTVNHAYAADGDYTITAGYVEGGKTATQQVTVPFVALDPPTFTVAETDPATSDHLSATASVTAAADGHTVTIDWGDESAVENVEAVPGSLDHVYVAGTYTVTAGYADSAETATQEVTVPFAAARTRRR